MKIHKRRLQQPHSKKNILGNERRNYQPKKLFKVKKKCDSDGQEIFAFILFY